MKTIHTTVYTIDELSPKAKARARDWWRELGDTWNSSYTIADAKTCLTFLGFTVKDIHFTGFWSQGDGACFTGTWRAADVQPGKLQEHASQDKELHRIAAVIEDIGARFPEAEGSLTHHGNYYHENSVDFGVRMAEFDTLAVEDEAEKALIEAARDAMRWIYRQLEADYNANMADEAVDEVLEANGYTFTEDGKRFG